MDNWEKRCEEIKEGKTRLMKKILEEIKQEGNTLETKPTELTKLFIIKKEKSIKDEPKDNNLTIGYDLDLCPF